MNDFNWHPDNLSPGESNVYTVGYIGPHKVVSTKLPAIGRQMAAQISAGNTTTRLLGKPFNFSPNKGNLLFVRLKLWIFWKVIQTRRVVETSFNECGIDLI